MRYATLTLLACALLAACADHGPPLAISNLTITPPVPGRGTSAAYFTLTNAGNAAVTVTRVASRQYDRVEMHETTLEDDIARMRQLEQLRLEPGASVTFERGGKHLMLMNPVGSAETVTLDFYSDADLLLSVSTTIGDAR